MKDLELLNLVKEKYDLDFKSNALLGSNFFLKEIVTEIDEVKEALDMSKQVFIEDELGDVFWDYLNLLYFLEMEGKIDLERVFSRAEKKYSERLNARKNNILWDEIKIKQKQDLEIEQNKLN